MKRLKLRGRIIERYGTLSRFAEATGVTNQTITAVLNGTRTPAGMAMIGWCASLGIDWATDEADAFFCPETVEN